MIENTFVFLDKVGPKTEKLIWDQGINDWNDFLDANNIKGINKARKIVNDNEIKRAKRALTEERSDYFARKLPLSEQWRLYDYFKDDAVFLDIETSGGYGYITVIGLYDGDEVKHFVKGANLHKEAFQKEISKYKLIVTFNGSSFDLPIINRYFREIIPKIPHVDLRHVCSKIGLTGGLKLIEKELGISRELDVSAMNGFDAVLLWDKFKVTEDEKYLKQLLKYNEEDIVNLKPLAEFAVEKLKKNYKLS